MLKISKNLIDSSSKELVLCPHLQIVCFLGSFCTKIGQFSPHCRLLSSLSYSSRFFWVSCSLNSWPQIHHPKLHFSRQSGKWIVFVHV